MYALNIIVVVDSDRTRIYVYFRCFKCTTSKYILFCNFLIDCMHYSIAEVYRRQIHSKMNVFSKIRLISH